MAQTNPNSTRNSSPPNKKRRLMPLPLQSSITDISVTPSPPVTPRYTNDDTPNIPHVNSTPIRNYFARFNDGTNSSRHRKKIPRNQRTITPRTLWKNSDKIIPFPPSKDAINQQINRQTYNLKIDSKKFDSFYHPLIEIINSRKDLNTFSDSYFNKTKKIYDEQPFLDPQLQLKMKDDAWKLLCNLYDKRNKNDIYNNSNTNHDNAQQVLNDYGDESISKLLQNVVNLDTNELGKSPIERARQFVQYLKGDKDENNNSYKDMNKGIIFLSGVLEYIMAILLDQAGLIAKFNHSITNQYDTNDNKEIFKKCLENNPKITSKYDHDIYQQDIDNNLFMIRQLHIRHTIHDDDELFWLQQSLIANDCNHNNNNNNNNIQDELNKDCVYHICSFFCGDLPMLSSLARVNTMFYAMTSSNYLWKPIAIRCFLFNPNQVNMIEDNYNNDDNDNDDDICHDFRSYLSLSKHIKLTILRERWIKQNRGNNIENDDNNELFEIFVRINPVYTDLHDNLYKLLYVDDNQDIDLFIDREIYDLFHQLLEIFGTRNDFITISEIINNIKCLNYRESQYRFSEIFKNSKNKQDEIDLNRIIEIENNDNHDCDTLFIEIRLSQNDNDDNNDRHYLWIGKHICLFAKFSS